MHLNPLGTSRKEFKSPKCSTMTLRSSNGVTRNVKDFKPWWIAVKSTHLPLLPRLEKLTEFCVDSTVPIAKLLLTSFTSVGLRSKSTLESSGTDFGRTAAGSPLEALWRSEFGSKHFLKSRKCLWGCVVDALGVLACADKGSPTHRSIKTIFFKLIFRFLVQRCEIRQRIRSNLTNSMLKYSLNPVSSLF